MSNHLAERLSLIVGIITIGLNLGIAAYTGWTYRRVERAIKRERERRQKWKS